MTSTQTQTYVRHTVARIPRQPSAPTVETRRMWSPKADLTKTVPPVQVDLRAPYVYGVAVGASAAMLGGLGAALYYLPRDERSSGVGLAVAALAFLTSLVAAYVHQRRTR
jgi:hypothetical protein